MVPSGVASAISSSTNFFLSSSYIAPGPHGMFRFERVSTRLNAINHGVVTECHIEINFLFVDIQL